MMWRMILANLAMLSSVPEPKQTIAIYLLAAVVSHKRVVESAAAVKIQHFAVALANLTLIVTHLNLNPLSHFPIEALVVQLPPPVTLPSPP